MTDDEPKQVILMRTDLNMRKGKMCAQAAHASLKVLLDAGALQGSTLTIPLGEEQLRWVEQSFAKVCLRVDSEEELIHRYGQAMEAGLPAALIRDEGRTEFKQPTLTCCAIGPALSGKINEVTGDLKLL